jgi:hypothetical protein
LLFNGIYWDIFLGCDQWDWYQLFSNGDFPGGWCVYGIWQPVLAMNPRTLVDLDVTNPAVTSISEENSRFTGGRSLIIEI